MPRIEIVSGFDAEGDACVFLQILNDEGEHIRYANEDEIRKFFRVGDREPEDVPENIGICVTCGAECSDDGTCEEACIDCGEHYDQHGDGYDGRCPACADALEEDDEDA